MRDPISVLGLTLAHDASAEGPGDVYVLRGTDWPCELVVRHVEAQATPYLATLTIPSVEGDVFDVEYRVRARSLAGLDGALRRAVRSEAGADALTCLTRRRAA